MSTKTEATFGENHTRNGWRRSKTTLETSEEDLKLHSKRVEKIKNYTRNEWRRSKSTLEARCFQLRNIQRARHAFGRRLLFKTSLKTSGEVQNTLETGGEDYKTTLEKSEEDPKILFLKNILEANLLQDERCFRCKKTGED